MRAAWLVLLVGCAGDVEERQQAALDAASDAVSLGLVAAELLQHTTEEPEPETTVEGARHAGACGCPCVYAVGTDDSYVQELDYEQPSCTPESELLPARIGGHVWLDYDRGEVALSRVQAWLAPDGDPQAEEALDVDLRGTYAGQPDLWDARVDGTIRIGDREASFAGLAIDLGRDVRLDGEALGGTLEGVALPRRDGGPCPIPLEGQFALDGAVVTWAGDRMVVDLDGSTMDVDACAYLSLP